MSGLYTRLVAQVLFPLHERLKGHRSVALRRALEQSQWLDPEILERQRLEKLRGFLARIGRTVPYYRDLFRQLAFDPAQIHALSDLQRLPLLDKATIRANQDRFKAVDAGPLKRFNTGGSSGEPLIFFVGRERVSHDVAAKWRATRWWGVDIGDREIVVWGSPIELGAQDRVRQLRDFLFRSRLLPAFEMSEANLDRFVAEIRRFRPAMLFGYPSSLAHIAAHAADRGIPLDDLGIRVAFVTSERLYDHQRETIQQVFGCPVANGYGGRDAGFIAHECPEGGMHISAEDILVEIVDADGRALPAGESGEIVVTHLATAEFPFVRYRTGDIGVLSDERCACGRGLPLLKEIQGRTTDFVVAEDGTVMHGLALIYVLRDLPEVANFRIVQPSRTRLEVSVVKGSGYRQATEDRIREALKQRLGQNVEIVFDYPDRIERERSGKFRYVVSRVAPR